LAQAAAAEIAGAPRAPQPGHRDAQPLPLPPLSMATALTAAALLLLTLQPQCSAALRLRGRSVRGPDTEGATHQLRHHVSREQGMSEESAARWLAKVLWGPDTPRRHTLWGHSPRVASLGTLHVIARRQRPRPESPHHGRQTPRRGHFGRGKPAVGVAPPALRLSLQVQRSSLDALAAEEGAREAVLKRDLEAVHKRNLEAVHKRNLEAAHFLQNKSAMEAVGSVSLLLRQVVEGLDIEISRCRTYHSIAELELHDTQDMMAQEVDSLGRADGAVQKTVNEQTNLKEQIERVALEQKQHKDECAADAVQLRSRIAGLKNDTALVHRAMGKWSCPVSQTLLQRQRHISSRRHHLALWAIRHYGLRTVMAQLASAASRRALRRALTQISRHGDSWSAAEDQAVVQAGRRRAKAALLQRGQQDKAAGGRVQKANRISGRKTVDCGHVESAMILMMADVEDKGHELNSVLEEAEAQCDRVQRGYIQQLTNLIARKEGLQATVATAIAERSWLRAEVLAKQEAVNRLASDFAHEKNECEINIKRYTEKAIDLRRTRAAIKVTGGNDPSSSVIQDCEVSQWLPDSDCSVTCGGGSQRLTRQVIDSPGPGGMPCPPLATRESCNAQPCPSDCRVSAWSGWSMCSALCGGGVRTRSRHIVESARFHGEPCPMENIASELCNARPCDTECVLGSWSPWSTCSMACGGGFRARLLGVHAPGTGNGARCPSLEARTQYQRCNSDSCPRTLGKALQCNSTIDLVIVLDGSAAGGTGTVEWEDAKSFVETLVESLSLGRTGAQVALVLAGGPTSWAAYQHCQAGTGITSAIAERTGAHTSCNVRPILPLTSNIDDAVRAIRGLELAGGALNAAGALSVAESVLLAGRRGHQKPVVLVLARGRPLSRWRIAAQSAQLRQHARLTWVSVGRNLVRRAKQVAAWVSRPARDNVLAAPSFRELEGDAKLANIVATVCPSVVLRT